MKKGLLKWSEELRDSIWVIVILAIIFGFNDSSEVFTWGAWLSNLLRVLVLCAITIFVHVVCAKLAANHFDQKAELRIWGINRLKFRFLGTRVNMEVKWNILGFKINYLPFGAMIGFLLTLMSMGTFYFTAISTIVIDKINRIGGEFYLREKNEALIYFWSLVGNLGLVALFGLLGITQGVAIGSYFVLWNLLPISDLLGAKIFFNNRILYVFFLVFSLLFLLLFGLVNIFWTIIICLFFAFMLALWYFFKIEYK